MKKWYTGLWKGKVMKRWIENSIYIIFGVMFILLLSILSFFQNISYMCKPSYVISNIAMIAILFVFLFLEYLCVRVKRQNVPSRRHMGKFDADRFVKGVVIALFFVQIYGCYNLIFLTDWDVFVVWNASKEYAAGNYANIAENYYFHQYPNNLLYMIIQAFLLNLHDSFGIFEGERGQLMSVVVINCAISSSTCLLVYKSARLLCSLKNSLFAFAAAVCLVGLSPWAAINYSDAMCLVFPVLIFYLFVCPRSCAWKKKLSQFFAVFVGCFSYYLKPQCFIMVIAVILAAILFEMKKSDFRSIFTVGGLCLCTLLGFFCIQAGIHSVLESKDIYINKEEKFGISHFLMMGMNVERDGTFCEEDVIFSRSFKTYQERSRANLNAAVERVNTMGAAGLLEHFAKKMLVTYSDGLFAWGMEGVFFSQMYDMPNHQAAPFMRSLFYKDGERHMVFATFEQFVWITVLFLCAFSSISMRKARCNEVMILMLSLIGLTIYFLLFEVRARYLYTYIPIFCILAAVGKQQVQTAVQEFFGREKAK